MAFKIKQKLNSQKGASITFALLIFLVCAVISSVVLTAGTAAAGRMSQMLETEQRYYSVTSAAELIKKMVEDNTVVVTRTRETEQKTEQKSDGTINNGTSSTKSDKTEFFLNGISYGTIETTYTSGSPSSTTYTEGKDGASTFKIKDSLLTYSAFRYALKSEIKNAPASSFNATEFGVIPDQGVDINLKLEGESPVPDSIAVDISESIKKDGVLEFTVTGISQDRKTSQNLSYKLKLIFEPDQDEISGIRTEDGPWTSVTDGGKSYTYNTITTETTTTTINWKLTSMSTTYD